MPNHFSLRGSLQHLTTVHRADSPNTTRLVTWSILLDLRVKSCPRGRFMIHCVASAALSLSWVVAASQLRSRCGAVHILQRVCVLSRVRYKWVLFGVSVCVCSKLSALTRVISFARCCVCACNLWSHKVPFGLFPFNSRGRDGRFPSHANEAMEIDWMEVWTQTSVPAVKR